MTAQKTLTMNNSPIVTKHSPPKTPKRELYESYKKLSNGLFDPIKLDGQLPASFYKSLSDKFDRCAIKRQKFRDAYVTPDCRDLGHEKAIEQAILQSDVASKIYKEKNIAKLRQLGTIIKTPKPIPSDNRFKTLPVKEPRLKEPAAVSVSVSPTRKKQKNSHKSLNHSLSEEQILQQLVEQRRNTINMLLDIIRGYWLDQELDEDDYHICELTRITWFQLAEVPLTAQDFIQKLEDEEFRDGVLEIYENDNNRQFVKSCYADEVLQVEEENDIVFESYCDLDSEYDHLVWMAFRNNAAAFHKAHNAQHRKLKIMSVRKSRRKCMCENASCGCDTCKLYVAAFAE